MNLHFIFKRRRFRELEQENQRLKQTVKDKTEEIRHKDRQLELLSLQLKGQAENREEFKRRISSIFDEISQEFRASLTLIMLPLEQLLESCRDTEQEERLNLMLRNSQELLTLIHRLSHLFNAFSRGIAGAADATGKDKDKENPERAAWE